MVPDVSIPPFLDLPKGVVSRVISTTQGDFACLDNAAAVPVDRPSSGTALFIPGFTGSKEDFIAVLAPLAATGQHAVAIDSRGQFETPGPQDSDAYSLDSFAGDVLAITQRLSAPIHLVGHSLGGLVAREVVLADPLAVTSLVLMSSGRGAIPPQHQPRMQLFAQVLAEHGLEVVWAAKQALEEEEGGAGPADPAVAEFVTRRFLASAPGSLLRMVDIVCSEPDRVAELAAVAPATLVLCGDGDDVWSPAEQRSMSETLGCDYVELPGVGHSPAADTPENTAAVLNSFWTTVHPILADPH